jgi:protein-ribulosamine 3-kinase
MNIPDSIIETLQNGHNLTIAGGRSVSGGSINQAYRVETNNGPLFLKLNRSAPDDFFEKEAEGLRLLKSAGSGLRIPEVIAAERPADNRPAFLLMEYIETGRSGDSFAFGEKLADLHKNGANLFGLDHNNYIGSLPQSNRQHSRWSDFFHEERILPQLKMAIDSGRMNRNAISQWNSLAKQLDDLLPCADPSLIHGDLWGGNYLFDTDGNAVLIDPAVYYGHPEMDLAFTKMFGGFSADFYEGYWTVTPSEPGFEERVPIYNLYPLLVHVNLFGGHYVSQTEGVLGRF